MKTIVYYNGKKISQKKAKELVGEKEYKRCLEDAKQTFVEDPLTCLGYANGLCFEFSFGG